MLLSMRIVQQHLLSFHWFSMTTAQQTFITRTDLVDAECQSTIWHETALPQRQSPLTHSFTVMSSTAHRFTTISVEFTPSPCGERGVEIFICHFALSIVLFNPLRSLFLTFLTIWNASDAPAKHAAEPSHTLSVPSAVLPLLPQRHTQAEMTVARKALTTGTVVLTRYLKRKKRQG